MTAIAPSCRPATTNRHAHPRTTAARCLRFIGALPSFVRAVERCAETTSEVQPLASDKGCRATHVRQCHRKSDPCRRPDPGTMLLLERPMAPVPSGSTSETEPSRREDRLDSWKEIATYLNRSVRTLHRWEKEEGLPVHRHQNKDRGSVCAYKGELDAWVSARSPDPTLRVRNDQPASARRSHLTVALTLAAAVLVIGVISYLVVSRFRSDRGQRNTPGAGLELISTFAGSHRWPSLSPDGRMVAFVSDATGTSQVWVKNLEGGDPIQITFGDRPALRPRWSARGDRIIYSVRGGGIWSV